MYHPDKPTYKGHFGADLDHGKNKGGFYVHLGINGSFLGGGFYRPPNQILSSIRAAIDYNGDELKRIIHQKSFVETFGGLEDEEALKAAPRGFSQDHPHIDLLRLKSFAVMHTVTQKEAMANDFTEKVVRVYREMLPLREYLNQAVSV